MTIPVTVSASSAAEKGERYEGAIPLERLERLREFAPGRVSAVLQVRRDAGRQDWVDGKVEGELHLECQVCLSRYGWPFDAAFTLALARDEADEERLLATAEPCLVEGDRLELHRIVEDELLLDLPMMPRCPACENAAPLDAGEAVEERVEVAPNPFLALKNSGLSGPSKARRK